MPLIIPQLDDRTWEDLTEEGRLLIPALAPGWTNHNASDPGITLLELFAYFCESFLFRLDQVSDENIHSFLKLINGPEWRPRKELRKDLRDTILGLQELHRAVTPEDYELLARSVNDRLGPGAPVRVARVKCVPRHNLDRRGSSPASGDAPAHVSLVILPDPPDADTTHLFRRVHDLIQEVRVLTTRVHIVAPQYLHVGVRLSLTTELQAPAGEVRSAALRALENFLSPVRGGPDGQGWPFGRSVYVSEICELLTRVPGVRSVNRVRPPGMEKPLEELTVDPAHSARRRYNRLGELEAIELKPEELVEPALREEEITVISGWRSHAS